MRFEVTLHTVGSWDAQATHSEYMRRKFDTVIKTDVLFCDDPQQVERARSEMRREEMWYCLPDPFFLLSSSFFFLLLSSLCFPDQENNVVLFSRTSGFPFWL